MPKHKVPNATEVRELAPNSTHRTMIARGLMPPDVRFFQAGRCRILLVPPLNGNGWYADFAREDRYPDLDEIQKISAMILPIGIQVHLQMGEEKEKDGSYHARVREQRVTEPFPLGPAAAEHEELQGTEQTSQEVSEVEETSRHDEDTSG